MYANNATPSFLALYLLTRKKSDKYFVNAFNKGNIRKSRHDGKLNAREMYRQR